MKRKKTYRCEGLIVDAESAQKYRLLMCRTAPNQYQLILIGMWCDKVDSCAWNYDTKWWGETITRRELQGLIPSLDILRVKQPKKLRVICT